MELRGVAACGDPAASGVVDREAPHREHLDDRRREGLESALFAAFFTAFFAAFFAALREETAGELTLVLVFVELHVGLECPPGGVVQEGEDHVSVQARASIVEVATGLEQGPTDERSVGAIGVGEHGDDGELGQRASCCGRLDHRQRTDQRAMLGSCERKVSVVGIALRSRTARMPSLKARSETSS